MLLVLWAAPAASKWDGRRAVDDGSVAPNAAFAFSTPGQSQQASPGPTNDRR